MSRRSGGIIYFFKKKRKTKTKHKQIIFLFPKQFVQNKSNTVSNFKIIIIIKKKDQKENRKWVLLLIDIQCTATWLSVNSELPTKKEGWGRSSERQTTDVGFESLNFITNLFTWLGTLSLYLSLYSSQESHWFSINWMSKTLFCFVGLPQKS